MYKKSYKNLDSEGQDSHKSPPRTKVGPGEQAANHDGAGPVDRGSGRSHSVAENRPDPTGENRPDSSAASEPGQGRQPGDPPPQQDTTNVLRYPDEACWDAFLADEDEVEDEKLLANSDWLWDETDRDEETDEPPWSY